MERKRNLTQSDVARICGISRERVSQLVRGIRRDQTPGGKYSVRNASGRTPMTLEQILERYGKNPNGGTPLRTHAGR